MSSWDELRSVPAVGSQLTGGLTLGSALACACLRLLALRGSIFASFTGADVNNLAWELFLRGKEPCI